MSEIRNLQPTLLWKWFDEICAIPHPSYHEQALARHIVSWAKQRRLEVEQDEVGNVLIRKPATQGMENKRGVVLQAHLDMVPQANAETAHNFETDPIQPYIVNEADGQWVTARGTTLGADNGIGMASALAILESDLPHGDIEVLLTTSEETGMEGAVGLRNNWLKHDLMINLDTEENGEIYVGCAGGENANLSIPFSFENNHYANQFKLCLTGLKGGHSGCDIHTNRGNAIKLIVRFLAQLDLDFSLVEISGGSIRNAIPREAQAIIAFNGEPQKLTQQVQKFAEILAYEYAMTEEHLHFCAESMKKSPLVMNFDSAHNIINCLNVLPCGVVRNSDAVANTVETSLSIGVLSMGENSVQAVILIRSLIESGTVEVKNRLRSLMKLAHGTAEFSGYYPGWTPQPTSQLLQLTQQCYRKILGFDPAIKVIHAGLECGLLKQHYPNLEVISIGPTICNAHSPDEKVHVPAVATYWQLLTDLLANMLEK